MHGGKSWTSPSSLPGRRENTAKASTAIKTSDTTAPKKSTICQLTPCASMTTATSHEVKAAPGAAATGRSSRAKTSVPAMAMSTEAV